MATSCHGVGVRDWVREGSPTAYRSGVEEAVSAATGAPWSNATSVRRDTWWEADGDDGVEGSRALVRFAQRVDVGAVALAGLDRVDAIDGAYRVRWGGPYVEKPAAGLVSGETAASIAETASWTFVVAFKACAARFTGESSVAEVRLAGASSSSTRLVQVAVGSNGNLHLKLERKGGGSNETTLSNAAVDDGAWHTVEVSFADAGGSGGTATVYLDGANVGTLATSVVFTAGNVRVASSGNHWVGVLEYYGINLSSAQLGVMRYLTKHGGERGILCALGFRETTGVTVDDATGSYDMTLSSTTLDNAAAVDKGDGTVGLPSTAHGLIEGERVTVAGSVAYNGTWLLEPTTSTNELVVRTTYTAETFGGSETVQAAWTTMQHPSPGHDGGVAHRWEGWRRRGYLDMVAAGAGAVETATKLETSPQVHLMMLVRFRRGTESSNQGLLYYGTTSGLTNFDWQLVQSTSGTLTWRANRHDGGSAVVTCSSTTSVTDGELHTVSARIGWGGAMSIAIDGVEEGTATAPAYTAASGVKLSLHSGFADWEVGRVVVARRVYTHAEAHAVMIGESALLPSRSSDSEVYLSYHMLEGSGTTMANRGSAGVMGNLTITSSGASWGTGWVNRWSTGAGVYQLASSERTAHNAYEIASGVNVPCDEVLLEVFQADGTSSGVRLSKLFAYEVWWPTYGAQSGNEQWDGPDVRSTAGRGLDVSPGVPGRGLSLTFPLIKDSEVVTVLEAAAASGSIWGPGGGRESRPVMLVRRVSDRRLWVTTCAVVKCRMPSSSVVSQGAVFTRGVQVGGMEVLYGQTG